MEVALRTAPPTDHAFPMRAPRGLFASGMLFDGAAVGDRLRFTTAGSALPGLGGAEIVVVRRDPRNPQQFGARFTEPEGGRRALPAILDAERAERDRLRDAKKEAERRGRELAAAAVVEAMRRLAETRDEPKPGDGARRARHAESAGAARRHELARRGN